MVDMVLNSFESDLYEFVIFGILKWICLTLVNISCFKFRMVILTDLVDPKCHFWVSSRVGSDSKRYFTF